MTATASFTAPVRVLLAGLGGYGAILARQILALARDGVMQLVGGSDPHPSATCRGLFAEACLPIASDYAQALDR